MKIMILWAVVLCSFVKSTNISEDNLSFPSSESKINPSDHEDGGNRIFQNVGQLLPNYPVFQPRSYSSGRETVCETLCTGSASWGLECLKDQKAC